MFTLEEVKNSAELRNIIPPEPEALFNFASQVGLLSPDQMKAGTRKDLPGNQGRQELRLTEEVGQSQKTEYQLMDKRWKPENVDREHFCDMSTVYYLRPEGMTRRTFIENGKDQTLSPQPLKEIPIENSEEIEQVRSNLLELAMDKLQKPGAMVYQDGQDTGMIQQLPGFEEAMQQTIKIRRAPLPTPKVPA